MLSFPVLQHGSYLFTLQIFLAAAQRAGNDRELAVGCPLHQVFFSHIGQRADHDVLAVVTDQLGRHAFESAAKKQVQKEGLQDVVAVVAQRDFGRAQRIGDPVQDAPPQATAQAAHRLTLGYFVLDDGIGVLVFDVKRHAGLL